MVQDRADVSHRGPRHAHWRWPGEGGAILVLVAVLGSTSLFCATVSVWICSKRRVKGPAMTWICQEQSLGSKSESLIFGTSKALRSVRTSYFNLEQPEQHLSDSKKRWKDMGHTAPVGGKQHGQKTSKDMFRQASCVWTQYKGDQCETSRFANEPSSILSADCIWFYNANILPSLTVVHNFDAFNMLCIHPSVPSNTSKWHHHGLSWDVTKIYKDHFWNHLT